MTKFSGASLGTYLRKRDSDHLTNDIPSRAVTEIMAHEAYIIFLVFMGQV
jgi:hypothetical protein